MTSSQVNVSETPPMSASDLEGLKDENGLYAGKFKSVEDLVGSYKELEGKLGAIDQTREEPEGNVEEQAEEQEVNDSEFNACLLYTSPSPRDVEESRMPSSA